MAFRPRQQQRYNRLKKEHFLRFEILELSKIALKIPYVKEMRKERRKAYRDAVREYKERGLKLTRTEWQEIIRDMYIVRGWLKKGKADVWAYIRANEERYKDKYPEYESPPRHRKVKVKRRKDFVSKYAKGLEAYEKGRMR